MGNCCTCCNRKNNNYDPYVDEDYMEYESPGPHRYTAVPSNQNNNQGYSTQPQTHPSSRPPDSSNTGAYSPPPVQPSTSPSRNSYNASQQPQQTQQTQQAQQQPPQYSQYSESVYLARNAQPTDSMLLDSMMKSSILATGYAANSGEFATSSSVSFGADSTTNSTNNFGNNSNNFGNNSGTTSSNNFGTTSNNFGTTSNNFGTTSNNFATDSNNFGTASNATGMDASLAASNSSSVYYDAHSGGQSYMLGSVNEGAFEPNPPTNK